MKTGRYPFTAIVGQSQVKLAIILNLIDPEIGGVLLSGQKGCAKSTIVRSVETLGLNQTLRTVPLNVTEDRLVGSVNLEKVIQEGEIVYEPGILDQADQGILYVDEVNLLSPSIANLILDASASKGFNVEREGISIKRSSRFILVGSMNPEEGGIRPQLLDRFGFCVAVEGVGQVQDRVKIMKNRLNFESDSFGFAARFREEDERLANRIREARNRYGHTELPASVSKLIAKICQEAMVSGHRADLALTFGARAHAAWMRRSEVTVEDVNAVCGFVLAHRVRTYDEAPPKNQAEGQNQQDLEPEKTESGGFFQNPKVDLPESQTPQKEDTEKTETKEESQVYKVDKDFCVRDVVSEVVRDRVKAEGAGRRHKTKVGAAKGRYVKFRMPKGKVRDIALDATLRVAAVNQRHRQGNHLLVKVETSDLREKVRESRTGNLILFLVDASGSMGIQKRMSAAKGAVLSLLKDAYQKRDTVGLMTFRGQEAQLVLNPTRSIDLAYQRLKEIETGGKTPLAQGVKRSVEFMKSSQARDANIVPVIVIISDGRGNVSLQNRPLLEEIMKTAEAAEKEKIAFVVVDSETGYIRLGLARKMAEALNAEYFRLDDLREEALLDAIHRH